MMWNDDYYHMIEKQFGSETMVRVANSHRTAIDFVEKVRMRPHLTEHVKIRPLAQEHAEACVHFFKIHAFDVPFPL